MELEQKVARFRELYLKKRDLEERYTSLYEAQLAVNPFSINAVKALLKTAVKVTFTPRKVAEALAERNKEGEKD